MMERISGFQRDLLAEIARLDDPKGVEIQQAISERRGEQITHGRLYINLDELADAGLVEKGENDGRSNLYRLTDEGRNAAVADLKWRAESYGVELE